MRDPLASPPPTAMLPASDADLHASLEAVLEERPAGPRAGIWLFVYGSMAGEPPFEPAEARVARLQGWNRRFCIADPAQRGEPEEPGLVLGLVPGEGCDGVAFRIGEIEAQEALIEVWRREMIFPFYRADWLPIRFEDGRRVHALAFVADETGPLIRTGLARDAIVATLRSAKGPAGSVLDYLKDTIEGLGRHGIHDPGLDALARDAAGTGETAAA